MTTEYSIQSTVSNVPCIIILQHPNKLSMIKILRERAESNRQKSTNSPSKAVKPSSPQKRMIIIDGSNVAYRYVKVNIRDWN